MSWNVTNTRVCPRACAAGALAVLLAASTMGVAQTSARQTTVPNAEIRKHIDREWFLKSLLQDNLGHWLTAAATPSGFFQVNLDRQWRPMGTQREATLDTQPRQVYNMSVGYEFSHDSRFLDALNKGAEFLISKMHDSKYGGYFARVAPDGQVLDDSKQSYGMSFAIFSLAQAARVTKNQRYAKAAMDALAEIKPMHDGPIFYVASMNRDFSKTIDSMPGRGGRGNAAAPSTLAAQLSGRRHGLNQHLFEALLALYDATGSKEIFQQMTAMLAAMGNLFDQENGYLPESFDENWKKLPGDRLNVGHLYEWAWLFSRAAEEGAPGGEKYVAMGNRMIDLGMKVGYNKPEGGIWSGADLNGNVTRQMIWWCQAELLRASAHYAIRHNRRDLWPYFDQSLGFLKKNFLDPQYGGWYYSWRPDIPRDAMDLGYQKGKVDGSTAASGKTSYHDTAMYHNILRITPVP